MSITTYAELQTAIADFLNRDDLTSVIPTFISLAESQINRDIRHYEMETRKEATASEQYLSKPTYWMETIRMVNGEGQAINLISRDAMQDKRYSSGDTGGSPLYYCHSGSTFELYPTPSSDESIELLYYKKVTPLSDTDTTNWLLERAPDVYLYGALLHTSGYLQEDTRMNTWASLYGAAVQMLNNESEKAKYSGSGLRLKMKGMG